MDAPFILFCWVRFPFGMPCSHRLYIHTQIVVNEANESGVIRLDDWWHYTIHYTAMYRIEKKTDLPGKKFPFTLSTSHTHSRIRLLSLATLTHCLFQINEMKNALICYHNSIAVILQPT